MSQLIPAMGNVWKVTVEVFDTEGSDPIVTKDKIVAFEINEYQDGDHPLEQVVYAFVSQWGLCKKFQGWEADEFQATSIFLYDFDAQRTFSCGNIESDIRSLDAPFEKCVEHATKKAVSRLKKHSEKTE